MIQNKQAKFWLCMRPNLFGNWGDKMDDGVTVGDLQRTRNSGRKLRRGTVSFKMFLNRSNNWGWLMKRHPLSQCWTIVLWWTEARIVPSGLAIGLTVAAWFICPLLRWFLETWRYILKKMIRCLTSLTLSIITHLRQHSKKCSKSDPLASSYFSSSRLLHEWRAGHVNLWSISGAERWGAVFIQITSNR